MNQTPSWKKTFIWVIVFSIAMGFLESAVVVYLRQIYYPDGFAFPLRSLDTHIALTEAGREFATMIMLLGIGFLAGKTALSRFAYFILSFAVWDILYYVFLKIILNWPESLLTWDILFLLPVVWVGPVIVPVIVSFEMIFLAWIVISAEGNGKTLKPGKLAWALLIAGSVVLVLSFIWDYVGYMRNFFSLGRIFFSQTSAEVLQKSAGYIPESYNWFLFLLAELMIIFGIIVFVKKTFKIE